MDLSSPPHATIRASRRTPPKSATKPNSRAATLALAAAALCAVTAAALAPAHSPAAVRQRQHSISRHAIARGRGL